ncbi:hypothetical protein [Paraburkholderia rhynchosiae]|uniref:Uncharacterized protein n=1 Tax=Paraburkholderia rhynchosiae TaxID=487049 RepID=A0A2N7WQ63_9BURK|nr:hypothetical protein [Paraburkholderia rhynchosiae]PMS31465.1 hypothetical protein C0Z16_10935 [Paraburkholderia rhynchosiae]CAB3661364.1 hypothetical protein LMG27174_01655 [Paraburkholderia rhynchosiae]
MSINSGLPHDRAESVELLKRVAKRLKTQGPEQPLSVYQDEIAKEFGYPNWSVMHKNVAAMAQHQFALFKERVEAHPEVQAILFASPRFLAAAKVEMEEWVRANYTPLIEFAFYDNESENGFSLPSEDINNLLQEEFDHRFPFDLIESVAAELELEGPWGDEDYWLGGDEPPPEADAAEG